MRAAWYDEQGPAADVLRVGDLPAPEPGPGEVRVRLHFSGINPGDTKKRVDWFGLRDAVPARRPAQRRLRRHRRASATVVDAGRVGQRVWVYGAQSYRPFGTAAQLTVVPAEQAVELPGRSQRRGRRLPRDPGHHRPPRGLRRRPGRRHDRPGPRRARRRRLAGGAARALGRRRRSSARSGAAATSTASPRPSPHAVALDAARPGRGHPRARARRRRPHRRGRVLRQRRPRRRRRRERRRHRRLRHPRRPAGLPVLADAVRQRHDPAARQRRLPGRRQAQAAARPHDRRRDGALSIPIGDPLPLDRIAEAHDRVDAGARERVLLSLP